MVEAREQEDDYGNEEEKTFLEEPAILDKFKAAAVITDGKFDINAPPLLSNCPLIISSFSLPQKGSGARYPRR